MPFEFHRHQIPLENGATIWRYMDLKKYKSLLEQESLFFCRTDKFSDPFEGSVPKVEVEHRIQENMKIARLFNNPIDLAKAQKSSDEMADAHMRFKRGIMVNCWHISNYESDAMWRLYLKDNEGVAIQSNADRIKKNN